MAQNHPSAPNPNQPKLVARIGGTGNGPVIDNNGTPEELRQSPDQLVQDFLAGRSDEKLRVGS